MEIISDPRVQEVFDNYPAAPQSKMQALRELVLDTAGEISVIKTLEETLRWGEPSYVTRHGSTLRMDWKKRNPGQYALYFQCTSRLVPTFRKLYDHVFTFEGDRAIVFKMDDELPETELRHCISLALTYHKIKHLPLLGA